MNDPTGGSLTVYLAIFARVLLIVVPVFVAVWWIISRD